MSRRTTSTTIERVGTIGWTVAVAAALLLVAGTASAEAGDAPRDFDAAAAAQPAPPEPGPDRVIGRVTGVHGRVFAESPDGTRRPLTLNAPIYPGDRLVTHRGAQLGVLSGDHYTGLNEDTELSYALTPGGAPEVRLVRGHVRVIDAGEAGAPARLATPALEIAEAGADTEIYAFPEKATLVSMVCALEGQVQAASTAGGHATVAEGGCAIAKPAEGIYAAGGAADPLAPVGAAGPPPMPASGTAADHFSGPNDVALAAAFALAQAPDLFEAANLITPCGTAATGACVAATASGGPTPPPPNPPSNPPIPGLPPIPPPPNPPSNPPVPGLPPVVP